MSRKELSLCIPTNGNEEWVIPVVNSIYSQNIDESLFEVVITDNGSESLLEEKIKEISEQHSNLIYKRTNDFQFLNQISCFKLATGKLIKFINHRMVLEPDAINRLLEIASKYYNTDSVVYFSNGNLGQYKELQYNTFNDFVYGLEIYSSWSGGLSIWSDSLEQDQSDYLNEKWFPHLYYLFSNKKANKYIINDTILMSELKTDESKKGRYNLWQVFAEHYLSIIDDLKTNSFITETTFNHVKKLFLNFFARSYLSYIVLKKPCSYDLSGIKKSFCVYYSNLQFYYMKIYALWLGIKKVIKKIFRKS